MKAAGNNTAPARLGLNLDQFVITGQGERRHGDRMLGCFGHARTTTGRRREPATLRRAGRQQHRSECSCKPHGTT